MAQRRCYGCMGLTDQPVCGSCGTPEEERNLPHQLPRGATLAGRFLVGKALEELPGAIAYLALDQSLGEPVRLLEFFPKDAARREGTEVKPTGPAFAKGEARFRRVSEALARDSRLTEVSGIEMTFAENGTCYRVSELIRGGTLKKYVEMRGGFLLPEEALGILDGLMAALDVFHGEGFSHGGLDWESIVLDSRGGPRLPRIGDNPGRNPREDVRGLCRIFLDCLGREPDERPGEIPGLTGCMAQALERGLSPEGGFASAGELRGAMLGSVPEWTPPEAPAPEKAPPRDREPARAGRPEAPAPTNPPLPPKKSGGRKRRSRKGLSDRGKKIGVLVLAAVVLLILGALGLMLVRNIHVWKEADCERPETCAICGQTRGEPLGHDWQEATCSTPKTCARCGALEGSVLGHVWQDATCTEPKTCARCGLTEGEALGHDWQAATCTEPEICARCGQTQGEPLGHDWQDAVSGQPRICARCGEADLEYIEALIGDWERFRWGNARTWCIRADEPVFRVWSLKLRFEPEIHLGIPISRWKFLYQEPGGDWVEYGEFRLDGERAEETIRFDQAVNISAVAVVPVSGGFTYDFSLSVTDIRCQEQTAAG